MAFSNFHIFHEFVSILMESAILYFGVLPWFWKVSIQCVFSKFSISYCIFHHVIYIVCITLQKSGSFLVTAGLNAENEILRTLSFLVGVMFWSQVRF